jgi:hypothetical protein
MAAAVKCPVNGPLPGTLGPLERRRISYVCSADPASFRVKTEELGRRYRGAVELGGVLLSLLRVRVVRRVLEAYAYASHPSCDVGQMSAPTVTLGTNSVRPVTMESVTIRANARPRVGLAIGPPRHQLDWTLEVRSAGEGPGTLRATATSVPLTPPG